MVWEPGKAAEVGSGVWNGTAEQGVASAEGNRCVWERSSGPAVSAAGGGTAGRPAAAEAQTDEAVNLAAAAALEPGASVMAGPKSLTQADYLRSCKAKVLPRQGLQKTNQMEAPGNTGANSC